MLEIKKSLSMEEWNLGIKNLSKTHLPSADARGDRFVVWAVVFLESFTKMRKVIISFILSIRMEHHPHWTDSPLFFFILIFSKFCLEYSSFILI
jgi:hypothetical protein